MALSLATVGAKITATFMNLIIAQVNAQGYTAVIPTSVAGTGVTLGAAGKVTFSASTAVSVNGCFTSTYDNYLIVVDISATSANSIPQFRLRLAGTDASGATDYYSNSLVGSGASTAAAAVRAIGRSRRTADSTMASHTDSPRSTSCSI